MLQKDMGPSQSIRSARALSVSDIAFISLIIALSGCVPYQDRLIGEAAWLASEVLARLGRLMSRRRYQR
jgi:hypothetical protein